MAPGTNEPRRPLLRLALALLAAAPLASAQYDQFFFPGTNLTRALCPGMVFNCPAPSVCAHDATVDKYYCCVPGEQSVCWTGSTACKGGDSKTASADQTDCGSYCCLGARETCTQRRNQINICWATAPNPLANVSDARVNSTYSSLSAASPTATRLGFALAAVTSVTATTTATSASVTSSATASATASTSPITDLPTSTGEAKGLSSGAIAGIVVGCVVGLAALAALAFFFGRRGRKQDDPSVAPVNIDRQTSEYQGATYGGSHAGPTTVGGITQYYDAKYAPVPQQAPAPPSELYAEGNAPQELPTKP